MKLKYLARLCAGFLALTLGLTVSAQVNLSQKLAGASVTTPHVKAELIALAPDGVQSGKSLSLGLQIQHQPGWHTYWKNPGDSGLPTQLTWTLPAGLTAGEIAWPTPKKIAIGNLANYGYDGALLLSVPVTVAPTFQAQGESITIGLKAQWLVCKTECIPEEGEFSLKLPVRGSTALHRLAFDTARMSAPKPHSGMASFAPQTTAMALTVKDLPAQWHGKVLEAFPEVEGIIQPAAKQDQKWDKGVWSADLALSEQRSASPDKMAWLLKIAGGQNNPAVRVEAVSTNPWPAAPAAAPAAPSPALEAALASNKQAQAQGQLQNPLTSSAFATWTSTAYWLAVLGALLGGVILNLMPCVLPVLAIKLLSFAPKKMREDASSVATVKIESTGAALIQSDQVLSFRASSGLFALGVVTTFAMMGLVLLALRGAGQSFGWGFQLQSPGMVACLIVLFLLIGLNLLDAFELRVLLPQKLAQFQMSSPSLDALASGALAVLVATPCTAPFMGASLGLAVTLPLPLAIVIFIALGVGMALPFLLIAAVPQMGQALLNILPKPGAWMQVLRHFLAWPILATVIWLLWVYAQQTSIHSVFALLLTLLLVMALLWAYQLTAGALRRFILIFFAMCLMASVWLWQTNSQATPAPSTTQVSEWQTWSPQAQQEAQTKGQAVFVDFTAAWCLTCQVNKSAVLNQEDTRALFKQKNVRLLRADWTRPDAAIAAELTRLGRTGLPVYAVYAAGQPKPQLLPEVLTRQSIESAL